MTVKQHKKIDFDSVDSPEHKVWKEHRELLLNVPAEVAGFRGCIGIGLLITGTTGDSWIEKLNRIFLPDDTLRWVSLVDVPSDFIRLSGNRMREVHWASCTRTCNTFGMPHLISGEMGVTAWDFRTFPFDEAPAELPGGGKTTVYREADVLSPSQEPQLFRCLNGIEWAMTSTAFHYRAPWRTRRAHFYRAASRDYDPAETLLLFGERECSRVDRPAVWMPRAYLGFPESIADSLYEKVIYRATGTEVTPNYPYSLRQSFVDDMPGGSPYQARYDGQVVDVKRATYHGLPVLCFLLESKDGTQRDTVRFSQRARVHRPKWAEFKEGEVIAAETWNLPDHWSDRPLEKRWATYVADLLGDRLCAFIRIWFERQAFRLRPGFLHMPSELVARAALSDADPSQLFFDVNRAMPYYQEACDSFVFPTLTIRAWDHLLGVLPGDVAYDLMPRDERLCLKSGPAHRSHRGGKKHRARRKTQQDTPSQPALVPATPGASKRPFLLGVSVHESFESAARVPIGIVSKPKTKRRKLYKGTIAVVSEAERSIVVATPKQGEHTFVIWDDTKIVGVKGGPTKRWRDPRMCAGMPVTVKEGTIPGRAAEVKFGLKPKGL